MTISFPVGDNNKLADLQSAFNKAFPYLRLDLYRMPGKKSGGSKRVRLEAASIIEPVRVEDSDNPLWIREEMTVGELISSVFDKYGLLAVLSRQSGTLWLEITMTSNLTLQQQNEHGRELSQQSASEKKE
ncbi:MAG: hypothetical protein EOO06_11385 [Chitinophagaceae bacterium]|nr:MAG: hypothetical protein EOO06_11385 [Chitinophagaceae bacterium]